MPEIIFASSNEHKAKELVVALQNRYTILTLQDIGFTDTIPEPFETFKENALQKALTIAELHPKSLILSEDSGLQIDALKGKPGIYSARYAQKGANETQSQANIRKVLAEMENMENRDARFVSTFCLRLPNLDIHFFSGYCQGTIARTSSGTNDFGYDPIFIPEKSERSFGEMSLAEKRQYSHREKALVALQEFLADLKF